MAYVDREIYLGMVSGIQKVDPDILIKNGMKVSPFSGDIREDEIKEFLGEKLDIWPESIKEDCEAA
jgi:hypothetical protein